MRYKKNDKKYDAQSICLGFVLTSELTFHGIYLLPNLPALLPKLVLNRQYSPILMKTVLSIHPVRFNKFPEDYVVSRILISTTKGDDSKVRVER